MSPKNLLALTALSGKGCEDRATPLLGRLGSQKGKIVGFQSLDSARSFRIDYDVEKGAHVNCNNKNAKGFVIFNGSEDVVDKAIQNEIPKTFNQ